MIAWHPQPHLYVADKSKAVPEITYVETLINIYTKMQKFHWCNQQCKINNTKTFINVLIFLVISYMQTLVAIIQSTWQKKTGNTIY
ncbi:MAG: hypothetical protein BGP13_19245 [Sphingobacteriales bacterium 40-81]|nr:MAG: hypothetical protein BGP13_19245 [Sphingobacteriales bacterium 40-81]